MIVSPSRGHRVPHYMTPTLTRPNNKSPLRYPGGKQRAAKRIADLFPNDKPLRIASPFLVVAQSLSLRLVDTKSQELTSAPVAAFWQQLAKHKQDLSAKAAEFVPHMDKDLFTCCNVKLEKSLQSPALTLNNLLGAFCYQSQQLFGCHAFGRNGNRRPLYAFLN